MISSSAVCITFYKSLTSPARNKNIRRSTLLGKTALAIWNTIGPLKNLIYPAGVLARHSDAGRASNEHRKSKREREKQLRNGSMAPRDKKRDHLARAHGMSVREKRAHTRGSEKQRVSAGIRGFFHESIAFCHGSWSVWEKGVEGKSFLSPRDGYFFFVALFAFIEGVECSLASASFQKLSDLSSACVWVGGIPHGDVGFPVKDVIFYWNRILLHLSSLKLFGISLCYFIKCLHEDTNSRITFIYNLRNIFQLFLTLDHFTFIFTARSIHHLSGYLYES